VHLIHPLYNITIQQYIIPDQLAPNCFLVFWLRSTGTFCDSDVFLNVLFLDDHNFINNHPSDLKLVPNGAPCDLLQSALKIRL
jgi:hypothetical protein